MRRSTCMLVPLALLSLSPLPAMGDQAAQTLPERKPGLWELKTEMDEGNGPKDQTMKMCIDAQMEKNTVEGSIADHKANCSSYDIKAGDGATKVDSECVYNGRKVISTTNMSGDFKSAFSITIQSTTTEPKQTPQSVVVKRTITQLGKFVGESCGDLKPGEAEGADGTRLLVQ
jgi:hypothetical protein